ncbi:hypothetical protein QEN19_002215 [Hanseniaspora menglaensis]
MIRALFYKKKTGKLSFLKTSFWTFSIVSLAGVGYSGYSQYRLEQSKIELSQNHFVKYKVKWRKFVDEKHYLLEIEPLKPQKVNVWNQNGYRKLWSVEIKQPQIHVVRNYTPLPLTHVEDTSDEISLKVLDDDKIDNGKLMFYIKSYDNGEVARWLSKLPIGHEIEVRGPYIEYEFPEAPSDEVVLDRGFLNSSEETSLGNKSKYKSFDINFFSAGTGIVTPLQLMLTQDPFKGKIQIIHACKNYQKELAPLLPLLKKLENHDRLKMHYFENFRKELTNCRVLDKIAETPYPFHDLTTLNNGSTSLKPIFSLVVGPDGFIESVCGPKYELHQGPITGYLGQKGWNNNTVFKLS